MISTAIDDGARIQDWDEAPSSRRRSAAPSGNETQVTETLIESSHCSLRRSWLSALHP